MLESLHKLRGATREPAKYKVIQDFLTEEFMKGHFETGQPLPSENTLAKTLGAIRSGVARSTVRQAVGALEKAGLVKGITRNGQPFPGFGQR